MVLGTSLNTTGNPPGGGGLRSGVAVAQIVFDAAQFADGVNIVIRDSRSMTQRIEADSKQADKAVGGVAASYKRAGEAAAAAGRQMQQASAVNTKPAEQSVRALERAYIDTARAAEQAAAASRRIEREGLNSAARLADSLRRADPQGFSARRNQAFQQGLADEARRALERLDAQERLLGPQGSASPIFHAAADMGNRAGTQYSQAYLAQVRGLDDQVANILRSQRPAAGLFGASNAAQQSVLGQQAAALAPAGAGALDAFRLRGQAFNEAVEQGRENIARLRIEVDDVGEAIQYGMVQGFQDAALAATALYAVFAVKGIGIANDVKRTELLFQTLSGSEERATENLNDLRAMAERTRQPVLGLVDAANQILPALRGGNASLDETVSLMQRLSILDPQQGLQGASIAIREFLSGETVSLQRRFELERSRLTAILASSGGDQRRAIRELTEFIEERTGLTEEAMEELGAAGFFAFERMNDSGRRLMDIIFRPLLNNLVLPLIEAFTQMVNIINSIDPAIVAGLVTAVTGVGLLRGIERLEQGRIIGARTAALSSRAVTTVVGAEFGIEAGLFAARALRPELGSQEDARQVVGDTFKQWIILVGTQIRDFGEILLRGGFLVQNAFEQVGNLLTLGGLLVTAALHELNKGIGTILEQIGLDLGLRQVQESGRAIREEAERVLGRRADPFATPTPFGEPNVGTGLLGDIQRIQDRLSEGLGFTPAQEATITSFRNSFNEIIVRFGQMTGVIDQAAQSSLSFGDIFREIFGGPDEEALERWREFDEERRAIEDEAHADTIEENTRFVNQVHQINRRWQQGLIEGLEDLGVESQRAIDIVTRGTFQQVLDATADAIRERNRTELATNIDEIRQRTDEQNIEDEVKSERRIAELRESANDDLIELEEERARRMQELWEDFNLAMEEAIAARDVTAAIRARRQFRDAAGDVEQDFSEGTQERRQQLNEEIADQREALAIQRADRDKDAENEIKRLRDQAAEREAQEIDEAQRQLERQHAAHEEQLTELNTQHIDRLNAITKQADTESRALTAAYLKAVNDARIQTDVIGKGIQAANQFWANAISTSAMNEFNRQHGIYTGIALNATQLAIKYAQGAAAALSALSNLPGTGLVKFVPPTQGKGYTTYYNPTTPVRLGGITAYASGTPATGVPYDMVAHLSAREKVINQGYASAIDNLFGHPAGQAEIYDRLAAGGGGMGMVVNNVFNDVGSHSIPQLEAMVYDVMQRVARAAARNMGTPLRGN